VNADQIRKGVNARLAEAREMLRLVKAAEETKTSLPKQNFTSTTLRGMVYISLYAALEYCITQGVQCLLTFVTSSRVRHAHLEYTFNAVALDPELTAIRNIGEKKKWSSRRSLFKKLSADTICDLPDTAFGNFLHNIWPSTIEEIFLCFGIRKPATPTPREIGYLTEIVEKRNAIAHGRDTAGEVGGSLTIQEMELRMAAVYAECLYFLAIIEEHASDMRFVRSRYRKDYRSVVI
jgi:hypothetical protein